MELWDYLPCRTEAQIIGVEIQERLWSHLYQYLKLEPANVHDHRWSVHSNISKGSKVDISCPLNGVQSQRVNLCWCNLDGVNGFSNQMVSDDSITIAFRYHRNERYNHLSGSVCLSKVTKRQWLRRSRVALDGENSSSSLYSQWECFLDRFLVYKLKAMYVFWCADGSLYTDVEKHELTMLEKGPNTRAASLNYLKNLSNKPSAMSASLKEIAPGKNYSQKNVRLIVNGFITKWWYGTIVSLRGPWITCRWRNRSSADVILSRL